MNENSFSKDEEKRKQAADLLEQRYCCEIRCADMDKSVLFAHHTRGCTIVAAKICANVVIFQNVFIGSNQRFNKILKEWDNIGTPILSENVIIAPGAKLLGPIIIGENTVIGASAIITKDIPANSVAYGVNQYRAKNLDDDFVINSNNISSEEIMRIDAERVAAFDKAHKSR